MRSSLVGGVGGFVAALAIAAPAIAEPTTPLEVEGEVPDEIGYLDRPLSEHQRQALRTYRRMWWHTDDVWSRADARPARRPPPQG